MTRLFRVAFPQHPVSQLSDGLIAEMLFAFLQAGTMHVARVDGAEAGFVVGGLAQPLAEARKKFIRAHSVRIAFYALLRGTLLRGFINRIHNDAAAVPSLRDAPYQLRLMAVSPEFQRHGVGSSLLQAFESTIPAGSAYHLWILASNTAAEQFYTRHGAAEDVRIGEHVRLVKTI